jgi:hypothetical protein
LWPMLLVQVALMVAVFVFPAAVHWLDTPAPAASTQAPMAEDEIARQMQEMSAVEPLDAGAATAPAAPAAP